MPPTQSTSSVDSKKATKRGGSKGGKRRSRKSNKTHHKSHKKPKAGEPQKLYCLCRQPDNGRTLMVLCDRCDEWYHPKCVGITDKQAETQPFTCPQCKGINKYDLRDLGLDSVNGAISNPYLKEMIDTNVPSSTRNHSGSGGAQLRNYQLLRGSGPTTNRRSALVNNSSNDENLSDNIVSNDRLPNGTNHSNVTLANRNKSKIPPRKTGNSPPSSSLFKDLDDLPPLIQPEYLSTVNRETENNTSIPMISHDDRSMLHSLTLSHKHIDYFTSKRSEITKQHVDTLHEAQLFIISGMASSKHDLKHTLETTSLTVPQPIICDNEITDSLNRCRKARTDASKPSRQQLFRSIPNNRFRPGKPSLGSWATAHATEYDTHMCYNCYGQVPSNFFAQHVYQCQKTPHYSDHHFQPFSKLHPNPSTYTSLPDSPSPSPTRHTTLPSVTPTDAAAATTTTVTSAAAAVPLQPHNHNHVHPNKRARSASSISRSPALRPVIASPRIPSIPQTGGSTTIPSAAAALHQPPPPQGNTTPVIKQEGKAFAMPKLKRTHQQQMSTDNSDDDNNDCKPRSKRRKTNDIFESWTSVKRKQNEIVSFITQSATTFGQPLPFSEISDREKPCLDNAEVDELATAYIKQSSNLNLAHSMRILAQLEACPVSNSTCCGYFNEGSTPPPSTYIKTEPPPPLIKTEPPHSPPHKHGVTAVTTTTIPSASSSSRKMDVDSPLNNRQEEKTSNCGFCCSCVAISTVDNRNTDGTAGGSSSSPPLNTKLMTTTTAGLKCGKHKGWKRRKQKQLVNKLKKQIISLRSYNLAAEAVLDRADNVINCERQQRLQLDSEIDDFSRKKFSNPFASFIHHRQYQLNLKSTNVSEDIDMKAAAPPFTAVKAQMVVDSIAFPSQYTSFETMNAVKNGTPPTVPIISVPTTTPTVVPSSSDSVPDSVPSLAIHPVSPNTTSSNATNSTIATLNSTDTTTTVTDGDAIMLDSSPVTSVFPPLMNGGGSNVKNKRMKSISPNSNGSNITNNNSKRIRTQTQSRTHPHSHMRKKYSPPTTKLRNSQQTTVNRLNHIPNG